MNNKKELELEQSKGVVESAQMENKSMFARADFLNTPKEIRKYLAIVFGITAVIGLLIAYQFYNGTMEGMNHLIILQMFVPALGVMLVAKQSEGIEYPKKLFYYYMAIVGVLFILNILDTFGVTHIATASTDVTSVVSYIVLLVTVIGHAVFFVLLLREKKEISKKWGLRGGKFLRTLGWAFFFIVLYNMMYLAGGLIEGNFDETLSRVLDVKFLIGMMVSLPMFALQFMLFFGEEYGWRFFLQPRIQRRFGKIKGVILLGLIWGIWHFAINLFYYSDPSNAVYSVLIQLVGCVYLGVVFAYIYERSKSIWCVSLIHFINNTYGFLYTGGEIQVAYQGDYKTLGISALLMTAVCVPFLLSSAFKKEEVKM